MRPKRTQFCDHFKVDTSRHDSEVVEPNSFIRKKQAAGHTAVYLTQEIPNPNTSGTLNMAWKCPLEYVPEWLRAW